MVRVRAGRVLIAPVRSAIYLTCTHKAVNTHMTDEQTERLQMRVSKDFIRIVDAWRRKQEDLPGRSEAIRRLVEIGLKAKK
jgi:hypothetical protein